MNEIRNSTIATQGEIPVSMGNKKDLTRKKNRIKYRKITRKFNRKKVRIFSELYYDFNLKNL